MRVRTWQIAFVAGVVLPVLGFIVAAGSPAFAVGLSAVGAGAAVALLLFGSMSVLLWSGTAIVVGVVILLLHALVRAVVPELSIQPYLGSLSALSLVFGSVSSFLLYRHTFGRVLTLVSRADIIFLLAALPVLASILLVNASNGYIRVPGGEEEFHARGYVNGDTMTLFALTRATEERARDPLSSGAALLRANPFAGNGSLEYPTLLHRTLADIMLATGADITRAAWWLIIPLLLGTVAVSVLLGQRTLHGQQFPLWSAFALLAALGSTWESFTYPQSHTFLTGLFLLFLLLLVRRDQSEARGVRIAHRFAIGTLAILLLFSNAVLGTAAVAIAVTANLLQIVNRRWPLRERISGLVGAAILLVLFRLFPPGEGALGTLNVAYTAIPQFLTAALPAFLTLVALWHTSWLHRSPSLLGAAVLLPLLAFVTLTFSGRDIIAENSPRFLYLLVLLGWGAVVPLVQRAADWWWRHVRHIEHSAAEHAVLWGGAAFAAVVFLLPSAASVARTLDELVRKPPHVVSADELQAYDWIREHTPADAIFLRALESLFDNADVAPLSLPAFTGRAQLRSEYWLSPDDESLKSLQAFFAGRGNAPVGAEYAFCGPETGVCPSAGSTVYSSGSATIRALGRIKEPISKLSLQA